MSLFGWLRSHELNGIEDELRKVVKDEMSTALKEARDTIKHWREASDLQRHLKDLQKELTKMEIQQDKKQEGWDRREREITHKVGLEKSRQEQELDLGKREAVLSVGEGNLEAERKRFTEQMDFEREHLNKAIERTESILAQVLKALPSAEIFADLTGGGSKK